MQMAVFARVRLMLREACKLQFPLAAELQRRMPGLFDIPVLRHGHRLGLLLVRRGLLAALLCGRGHVVCRRLLLGVRLAERRGAG